MGGSAADPREILRRPRASPSSPAAAPLPPRGPVAGGRGNFAEVAAPSFPESPSHLLAGGEGGSDEGNWEGTGLGGTGTQIPEAVGPLPSSLLLLRRLPVSA